MYNLLRGGFNYLIIVIVFPFLLLFMTYYGFESSYVKLKHLEQPPDFIFSSVYAYRIIPNYVSVEMNNILHYIVECYLVAIKPILIKNGTIYYHSIFLTNTLFFGASFIIMERIINLVSRGIGFKNKVNLLLFLIGVFVVCMTQYVPTNGDSIALMFFFIGVFFSLKYKETHNNIYVGLAAFVIFVSTFVRETACLNIAFFAALFVDLRQIFKIKKTEILNIGLLVISFVVPYVLLRTMIVQQDVSYFEGFYLKQNFTSPFNLLGLVYGIVGVLVLKQFILKTENQKIFLSFLFFSIPYFIMITLVGLFWETRLFLPILVVAILLAANNQPNLKMSL